MKKIMTSLLALLLLLPLVFTFTSNGETIAEAADNPEEVTIYLHKRIFRDLRWKNNKELEDWEYQNDGLQIVGEQLTEQDNTLLENSLPLNGAMFDIYDATPWYKDVKEKGQLPNGVKVSSQKDFVDYIATLARKEAIKMAEESKLTKVNAQAIVSQKTEMPDGRTLEGIATFPKLPVKSGDEEAAYLILETGLTEKKDLNVDMEKLGRPLLITLPIYVNNESLTQIHLYPKNVGYVRDPYFFKFGQQASGEDLGPIAGAKFAIYREEDGKKLYLDMSDVNDLKNKWVESEDPLHDDRVNIFESDKDGLVNTGARFLPSGTFYFEELESAEGFVIGNKEKRIKIEVPESWYDEDGNYLPVLIDGQPMLENPDGEVPAKAMEEKTPRVYNTQEEPPTESSSTTPSEPTSTPAEPTRTRGRLPQTLGELVDTVATTARRMLPKTNEGKAAFSLFGVILAGGAVFLWKKKNDKDDK
ncbi:LPXTG cell wall anchor domain-containing protein [Enterococcus sp. MJM12]|uniref:LPXTG cell wall anchor domain-containing protein n=1 Tax=Candidatus Enterococcus myersii TaxID=2815322 RepID=A0ABS3H9I2_9ENTE|nr:pilin N-terminal domain-containing protein [Enterococcus sp. MJM12]MBO0449550.1 LPXTG cell wall anchor domain-containing protein [Enterococcus sp. MJM12]